MPGSEHWWGVADGYVLMMPELNLFRHGDVLAFTYRKVRLLMIADRKQPRRASHHNICCEATYRSYVRAVLISLLSSRFLTEVHRISGKSLCIHLPASRYGTVGGSCEWGT